MLFRSIGVPELLIILAVVVLVFGVGRIGKIGAELGSGIRAFKKGLEGDEKKEDKTSETTTEGK